ncbi:hypothetical protein CLH_2425 [Clostridium botulinum E3 str. Alaska E43]|nr:hypothetical protein CLH_2425 [Clostridium botulinum E3 str. Alaska E43]
MIVIIENNMNCNIIYEKIKDLLPKDKIDALYLYRNVY